MRKLIIPLLTLITTVSTAHASPLAFRHTGRMLDAAGDPSNDVVTLTVSLSTTQEGDPFWAQEFPEVPLQDGYFAVEVGAGPPVLTAEDLDRDEVWMTTGFPTGATTSHRLLAVPYAGRAQQADSLVTETGLRIDDDGITFPDGTTMGSSTDAQRGDVVQMAAVQTRSTTSYTAPPSGTGAGITPLDIVMTPRKAGNRIVLDWTVHGEVNHEVVWVVTRNGQLMPNASNSSNSRWAGTASYPYDNNDNSTMSLVNIRIIDTNSLAEQTTYRVHVRSSESATKTFRLNRTLGRAGQDAYENALSMGTATEIWW